MTMTMIAYSLSRDGIRGPRAIMYTLICSKLYTTQSHLERAKRRRLQASRDPDDQEMKNFREEDNT